MFFISLVYTAAAEPVEKTTDEVEQVENLEKIFEKIHYYILNQKSFSTDFLMCLSLSKVSPSLSL